METDKFKPTGHVSVELDDPERYEALTSTLNDYLDEGPNLITLDEKVVAFCDEVSQLLERHARYEYDEVRAALREITYNAYEFAAVVSQSIQESAKLDSQCLNALFQEIIQDDEYDGNALHVIVETGLDYLDKYEKVGAIVRDFSDYVAPTDEVWEVADAMTEVTNGLTGIFIRAFEIGAIMGEAYRALERTVDPSSLEISSEN